MIKVKKPLTKIIDVVVPRNQSKFGEILEIEISSPPFRVLATRFSFDILREIMLQIFQYHACSIVHGYMLFTTI